MLTAYDYSMAQILDESGIDAILVGDSLAMPIQGKDSTLDVTLDEMLYHCRCVARGVTQTGLCSWGTCRFFPIISAAEQAVRKMRGGLIQEGKMNAVKLEGGRDHG